MVIDAHTKLYCLFGNPARHSLSPLMHNTAFNYYGLNAVYLAFETPGIEEAIRALRCLPIHGASITIPFKTDVIHYIDSLDPLAEKIGSVNTLTNNDGSITGFNTDGYGALLAITSRQIDVKNKNVLILGNGGSARAIAFTLLSEKSIVFIAGRNATRVKSLCDDLSTHFTGVSALLFSDLDSKFTKGIDIIINTTPVGMLPSETISPINKSLLRSSHVLMDIVYQPRVTQFLRDGIERGCTVIEGTNMLIFQGIKQFELWTGLKAPYPLIHETLSGSA